MRKLVTFQIEAELVEPLIETLQSRVQAWQETARILRSHRRTDDQTPGTEAQEAMRKTKLYHDLIEEITNQLKG